MKKCGGECERVYGVRAKIWGVWEGKERCGGCEEVWGNVWESVWGECGGCRKVCWGVGEL